MKFTLKKSFFLLLILQLLFITGCKKNNEQNAQDELLPFSDKVVSGVLDNGLKFYIKQNDFPSGNPRPGGRPPGRQGRDVQGPSDTQKRAHQTRWLGRAWRKGPGHSPDCRWCSHRRGNIESPGGRPDLWAGGSRRRGFRPG